MSVNAEILRTLHRLHRQQADLRERLQRGPMRVQASEALVKKLEDELAAAKEGVRRARIAADEKNLQLRDREARLAKLRDRLNEAASNREYQTFKEQIAADEQANSVLADEVFEALEKIEALQKLVVAAESHVAKGREDSDRIRQQVSGERESLEGEFGRISTELKGVEATLPGEFRAEYLNAIRGRGEDGMAPLEGEACGGCYQNVTPNLYHQISDGRPAFCKSCGRLLYLPEGR